MIADEREIEPHWGLQAGARKLPSAGNEAVKRPYKQETLDDIIWGKKNREED